jgi:hypothetical protein
MSNSSEDDEIKGWRALLALRQVFDSKPTSVEEVTAALESKFCKLPLYQYPAGLALLEDGSHYLTLNNGIKMVIFLFTGCRSTGNENIQITKFLESYSRLRDAATIGQISLAEYPKFKVISYFPQ